MTHRFPGDAPLVLGDLLPATHRCGKGANTIVPLEWRVAGCPIQQAEQCVNTCSCRTTKRETCALAHVLNVCPLSLPSHRTSHLVCPACLPVVPPHTGRISMLSIGPFLLACCLNCQLHLGSFAPQHARPLPYLQYGTTKSRCVAGQCAHELAGLALAVVL